MRTKHDNHHVRDSNPIKMQQEIAEFVGAQLVAWGEEVTAMRSKDLYQPGMPYHALRARLAEASSEEQSFIWQAVLDYAMKLSKHPEISIEPSGASLSLALKELFAYASTGIKDAMSRHTLIGRSERHDLQIIHAIGCLHVLAAGIYHDIDNAFWAVEHSIKECSDYDINTEFKPDELEVGSLSEDPEWIKLKDDITEAKEALLNIVQEFFEDMQEQFRFMPHYHQVDQPLEKILKVFDVERGEGCTTSVVLSHDLMIQLMTSKMFLILANLAPTAAAPLQASVVQYIDELYLHMRQRTLEAEAELDELYDRAQLEKFTFPLLYAASVVASNELSGHLLEQKRADECAKTLSWFDAIHARYHLSPPAYHAYDSGRLEPLHIAYWRDASRSAKEFQGRAHAWIQQYNMLAAALVTRYGLEFPAKHAIPQAQDDQGYMLSALEKASFFFGQSGTVDREFYKHWLICREIHPHPDHKTRTKNMSNLLKYFFDVHASRFSVQEDKPLSSLITHEDKAYFHAICEIGWDVMEVEYHYLPGDLESEHRELAALAPQVTVGSKRSLEAAPHEQPSSKKHTGISGTDLVALPLRTGRSLAPSYYEQYDPWQHLPSLYPSIIKFYQIRLFTMALADILMEQFGLKPGTEGYLEQALFQALGLTWKDRDVIREILEPLKVPKTEREQIIERGFPCAEIRADLSNPIDWLTHHIVSLMAAPPTRAMPTQTTGIGAGPHGQKGC